MPPLESYDVTHGICRRCIDRGVPQDQDALKAIGPVADFFRRLRSEARKGFTTSANLILEKAEALGIRPLELMLGLLQPALEEMGRAWARGEISAATEHRFSSMVEAVASFVLHQGRESQGPPAIPPDFLLASAEGNFHTLGLRMVEAFLVSHGRSVVALAPGLTTSEVLAQVRSLRPRVLGISVSLPAELESLRELSRALQDLPPRWAPQLVVGGSAIRAGAQLDPALGACVCTHLPDLLDLVEPAPRSRAAAVLEGDGALVTAAG